MEEKKEQAQAQAQAPVLQEEIIDLDAVGEDAVNPALCAALCVADTVCHGLYSGLYSGLYAVVQGMFGAIGGAVLKSAGHEQYSARSGFEAAAVGGVIMAIPTFLLSICFKSKSKLEVLIYTAATAALCGVVGTSILSDLSTAEGAAASVVGASVFCGASALAAYYFGPKASS